MSSLRAIISFTVVWFMGAIGCASDPEPINSQDSASHSDGGDVDAPDAGEADAGSQCSRVQGLEVVTEQGGWSVELAEPPTAVLISGRRSDTEWAAVEALTIAGDTWMESGWWDGQSPALHLPCCVRAAAWPGLALAFVPSDAKRAIPAGRLGVSLPAGVSKPEVTARFGEPAGLLALDVVLHHPSSSTLEEHVSAVQAASDALTSAAEISLSVVDSVPHSLESLPTTALGDYGPALVDDRQVVHLVLVPSIDGGVLGAAPVGGPMRGGVVLVDYDQSDVTRAVAHELMHFLGLWHLREPAQPGVNDPLGDTPLVDEDNLMSADAVGGLELSPEQVTVSRRHPILRGLEPCE